MKPIWKWIIGIVGILLIILLGAAWYLNKNWKPLLESKLQEIIHDSTEGLYSLKYDDLDLNILLGNITLTNAELIPDSTIYEQLVLAEKASNSRFYINLNTLKIRRINIRDILFSKKLEMGSILLESPNIHLVNQYHSFNDTVSNEEPKGLHEKIKDALNSISIKDIQLSNVNFKLTNIDKENKESEIQLDSVQLKLHNIMVDEASAEDTTRLFYTKMIDAFIPGFEYDLPDGFYRAKFEDLAFNTQDQRLQLTQVSFAPTMNKSTFFKRKNMNVTMAVLNFDTIRVDGLDFRSLVNHQKIAAKSTRLKNGATNLYMDKRYPPRPGTRIGTAPHQQLMKINMPLHIDTVWVDNVDVLYGEMSGKFHQEGIITFNAAQGTITNVTNDSVSLQRDKFMRADLRAKIMNSGNLHAQFGFDMLSKNGAHTYKGSLGAMNATAFNRILTPLLNAEIGSGNIKKITFDMQGTDYRNWGDFRFDYDNMKIRLLGDKDDEGKRSNRRVLSFMVNQILINDSNPDANEKYHIGKITDYRRDPSHSFFKTLWQSLLEGIKQCAGISPDLEAQLTNTAAKAQRSVSKTKEAAQKTGGFLRGLFRKKDKDTEDK